MAGPRQLSVLDSQFHHTADAGPGSAEAGGIIREIMNQSTFPLNSRLTPDDSVSFIEIEQLLVIARRRAKTVALSVAFGILLGVLYVMFTPAQYTTITNILLDDSLTRFAQDKTDTPDLFQSEALVLSEVEILKSERLARAVVTAEKLDQNESFLNPPISPIAWAMSKVQGLIRWFRKPPQADDSGVATHIADSVSILQDNVDAERIGRSLVITLSYQNENPELAGRITRAYANAYLSDQLEANFEATKRATIWLQDRIAELRETSQRAASEVEGFRAEHGLTSARGELMSDQQMIDLNSQLILAQADSANALARYNQFKTIVADDPESAVRNAAIPVGSNNSSLGAIGELKTRYADISKREREIVDKFGEDHPQAVALRREQADLTRQIYQELQQLTESYRNEYEIAKSREESLRANAGLMAGQSSQTSQDMVKLRELQQKADALSALYQGFLSRHEDAAQQQSLPIAKARVISEAADPVAPSSPRKGLVLGLSLLLGLVGGVATAALQEFRERFFRTGEDVRTALNVNFLGYLPVVRSKERPTKPGIPGASTKAKVQNGGGQVAPRLLRVAVNRPSSSFAETLRNAKLAADVVLHDKPCKVIGFVSVLPNEGKTTVAANFAALIAGNGARTLLIDGDLRNPGLSRGLSLTPEKGLVEAIIGEQRWQSTIMIDRTTSLGIIPASVRGRLSHTSELLSGHGMRGLIAEARKAYDFVVVDLPPLGPVVDAKAFAPLADGFVMIAEWGETPRALVRATLQGEPQVAAKLLGVILNKTDLKMLARYGAFGSTEQFMDRYSAYYVDQMEVRAKG